MEILREFKGLDRNDAPLAGGKGASLGEMTQAGISVPPGFVVLAEAFEHFIHETDLVQEIDAILHKVNHKEIHTVEYASEEIKALILAAEMPRDIASEIKSAFKKLDAEYVAVRSSATAEDGKEHAWAGQLESYLNTTEADLLDKVKHCWASLFTPRAIFYRFEKDLHKTKISVAVVVQKMVDSEISGIAFSVHPVTQDYNQLIIEAGLGLGEAIVSGQITPDSYVVEKEPRNILDINVATQGRALYKAAGGGNEWCDVPKEEGEAQVLSKDQILELSELVLKIEDHYGFPCDIEWAYEKGKFYIVQSRPITTLAPRPEQVEKKISGKGEWGKSVVGIDAKDYYLNFKAKGPSLYFIELGTIAYDPNQVINIVKDGLDYSFYTKEAERKNAKFAKKKDFFDIVASAKQEIESLHKKYKTFDLPKTLISTTEFEKIHKDFIKTCSLYRYVNNSYLDTFLTTGTKDQVSKIGEYKNEMQKCLFDLFFSDQCVYKKLLRNISTNTQISLDDIEQYYHTELISLITENQKLDQNVIVSRKQISAITKDNDGKLEFISSDKASALFDVLYGQNDNQGFLKGMTGHTNGRVVKGKVKIIHTDYKNPDKVKREMAEMEEGQVLVSQITAPELMPAIKKASAIVTDIGGMLSHAAIISRELDIPCVIGTKNASEVLKDGDMVEVNAEKGVVRLLGLKIIIPDLKEYQRLFQFHGAVPFFLSYEFVQAYVDLDGLAFGDDHSWLSYMSQSALKRTLNEGLELYKDEKAYEKYKTDLYETYEKIKDKTKTFSRKKGLSRESASKYLSLLQEYRELYRNTEFFYTDLAFQKMEGFPVIKKNFESFDSFKIDGRKYLNEIYFLQNSLFITFLKVFSTNFAVPIEQLLHYSPIDLISLFDGKLVDKNTLNSRSKAHIIFIENGEIKTIIGEEAHRLIRDIKSKEEEKTILSGQIAFKGKVKGAAKVIKVTVANYHKVSEFVDSMEQGQILVAETTEPSIVAACKKAAAIVTNQGGMMSHAAIVAREFNIPCIVGTGNATEVINDGDLVEVDADKGIVRILDQKMVGDLLSDVKHWHLWGRWKLPLFTNVPYNSYGSTHIFKELKFPKGFRAAAINMDGYVYALEADHKLFDTFVAEKFRKDHFWFENLFNFCEKTLNWADKVRKNKDVVASMEIFDDIGCLTMLIHFCDKGLESLVSEVSSMSGLSAEDFVKVLVPYKPTYTMQYKDALRKHGKTNPEQILKDFDWIGSGYLYGGKRLTKKDIKQELEKLHDEHVSTEVNIKDLTPHIQSQITILQKLIYYRSINAELVSKLINSQWDALDELALKYDTSREEFGVLTPAEIVILAKGGDLPTNFRDRLGRGGLSESGLSYIDGELKMYFGVELKDLLRVFEQKSVSGEIGVRGAIAFKGIVRGVVKIVESTADLQKINEGDIIVSPETMPDYVVGMQKAAAFVTNQGGITSHAAIVARELRKPCIISTKNATKVFKDGDLVEVDADRGTVKILK